MLTVIDPKARYAPASRNRLMYVKKHIMAACTENVLYVTLCYRSRKSNSSIFALSYLCSADACIWKLASNLIPVLPSSWRLWKNLHPHSSRKSCLPIRLSLEPKWTNGRETNKRKVDSVATRNINFQK